MSQLTLELTDEILHRLEDEAERQNVPVTDVVREALELYLEDDNEPTKEEILAGLREAMQDALAGRVRPVDEVLEEIRKELADNANNG